jgi:hypothetical protein
VFSLETIAAMMLRDQWLEIRGKCWPGSGIALSLKLLPRQAKMFYDLVRQNLMVQGSSGE